MGNLYPKSAALLATSALVLLAMAGDLSAFPAESVGRSQRLPPNMQSQRFNQLGQANKMADRIATEDQYAALRSVDLISHGAGYPIENAAHSALNLPLIREQAILQPLAPVIYQTHYEDPCRSLLAVYDGIEVYLDFIIAHGLFFKAKAQKLRRFGHLCRRLIDPSTKSKVVDRLCTNSLLRTRSLGHDGAGPSSPMTPGKLGKRFALM